MIENYMNKHCCKDSNNFNISCLTKCNSDISTLSFISFKIDASNEVAKIITSSNFWPIGCTIKDFIHKSPMITNLTEEHHNDNTAAARTHYFLDDRNMRNEHF